MIRKSFVFLEKISNGKERSIWEQGIHDWESFTMAKRIRGISRLKKGYYDRRLHEAQRKLYSFDSAYFSSLLPRREHWRLYDFFKEDAVFLDIETSGLEKNAYINIIGLFDGSATKTMVRGFNMDEKALAAELSRYKLIVSYNGSSFDIPFLLRKYPNSVPNIPHFDLRAACRKIGLAGGLKEIEAQLGIRRSNNIVKGLSKGDPAELWRCFKATGDDYYLNLLIEYNEEDTINLKRIAQTVYSELCRVHPYYSADCKAHPARIDNIVSA